MNAAALPLSRRERIAAQLRDPAHPDFTPPGPKRCDQLRSLGFVPLPEDSAVAPLPVGGFATAKKAARSTAKTVASIRFASETEADIYARLRRFFVAVFCHPRIALGDAGDREMRPDFIAVRFVNKGADPVNVTLGPGEFIARAYDAKAAWRNKKTGVAKVHAERDWQIRRDWLRDQTGIDVQPITKREAQELEGGGPC